MATEPKKAPKEFMPMSVVYFIGGLWIAAHLYAAIWAPELEKRETARNRLLIFGAIAGSVGAGLWWLKSKSFPEGVLESNNEACSLLNQGDLKGAIAKLSGALATAEGNHTAAAIIRFNLGDAQIRLGEQNAAIENLSIAIDRAEKARQPEIVRAAKGSLSIIFCIRGDMNRAEQLLNEAKNLGQTKPSATLIFPSALIKARREQFQAAADEIQSIENYPEEQTSPSEKQRLQILLAYSTFRLSGAIQPRVDGAFDWLAANWPDFNLFLQTQSPSNSSPLKQS